VERFFRTVRDQFLGELHANTLERLNADLKTYLAEYHKRIHRGIGASPLQKRFAGDNVCRLLPEVTDLTKLFFLKRRCRVYNDATIRIAGLRFEVPGCAPGYIDVHYMPWDKSKVFYDDDLKPARLLDSAANANRFTHPEGGKS
jgi:putative transposase